MTMDIRRLSNQYCVRDLLTDDAPIIYKALKNNSIFYQYHPPAVTIESILNDMKALPFNKEYKDKHYIGFFQNTALIAVMDIIENYPDSGKAFIGFFAINTRFHGNGIGTAIISDCIHYLAQLDFKKVRLGIDKGNPQSKAFWTKNGFQLTGEEFPNSYSSSFMMEKKL